MYSPRIRQSLSTLPGRYFREPAFAAACVRCADAVADELIYSADLARPQWTHIVTEYPAEMERLLAHDASDHSQNLFEVPLVRYFVNAWVHYIRWPIVQAYSDGFQFRLPDAIQSDLKASSSVAELEFYLASLGEVCQGRLGYNDYDNNYGLSLNAPIWIPLAVRAEYRDSFAQQLRMMVHHETGHFRWLGGTLRAEHIAHARGVAALRNGPWPVNRKAMEQLLKQEYPEAWANEEIRSLVQETTGGVRLIREWGKLRQRLNLR